MTWSGEVSNLSDMGEFQAREFKTKTGESILIRHVVERDAEKLNDLARDVFQTSSYLVTQADEFSATSVKEQAERIQRHFVDTQALILVAEYEDEFVGMLDFRNVKRKRIQHFGYFGMSVRSGFRGRGVGSLLLQSLIEWISRHEVLEVIGLKVIEKNDAAFALYKKFGFQVTGREPFAFKIENGEHFSELTMSLKVK